MPLPSVFCYISAEFTEFLCGNMEQAPLGAYGLLRSSFLPLGPADSLYELFSVLLVLILLSVGGNCFDGCPLLFQDFVSAL